MNASKKLVFFVFFLHALLVGVFLVQPGCHTHTPMPPPEPLNSITYNASTSEALGASTTHALTSFQDNTLNTSDAPRVTPRRPLTVTSDTTPLTSYESSSDAALFDQSLESHSKYTIQKGDTLGKIAKQLHVSLQDLLQLNNLTIDSKITTGKTLLVPEKALLPSLAETATTNSSQEHDLKTHKVVSGDSLSTIAHRYKTNIQALKQLNNLKSNVIIVGQSLKIPTTQQSATSAPVATTPITKSFDTSKANVEDIHMVASGETLSDIAKIYHTTSAKLMQLNHIEDPRKLKVGQALLVKENTSTTTIRAQKVYTDSEESPVLMTRPVYPQEMTPLRVTPHEEESDPFASTDSIPIIPIDIIEE